MPNSRYKVETVSINKLHCDPANARKHGEKNLQAIKDSLSTFGQQEPLVVDRTGKVIGGNGRLEAMRDMGWTEVAVHYVDLDSVQTTALGIALNRTGELAEWDHAVLDELLGSLKDSDFDVGSLGYGQEDLDALTRAVDAEQIPEHTSDADADDVPQDVESTCQAGDLWQLGKHRLLCGNSGNEDDLKRLIGDARVDCVFTDPPYGMHLNTNFDAMFKKDKAHKKKGNRFSAVIGDDTQFDATVLLTFFSYVKEIVLWGADYYMHSLPADGSWFVWDKRCEENMDKVVGNVFELAWSKKSHKREVARILWSGHHGMGQGDEKSRVHPTQKPVALIKWFFERIPAKVVADPFAGSGSTLIACELTGRTCLTCDVSPQYCDVVLRRWSKLTGQDPILISDGSNGSKQQAPVLAL